MPLPKKSTVEKQIGRKLIRGWILDGAGPARYGWGAVYPAKTVWAGKDLLDVISRHGRGLLPQ